MSWPERPICHDDNWQLQSPFRLGRSTWREPRGDDSSSKYVSPRAETFRTCSYCGSIHPEDLVKVLAEGATLGGSDWKYGWPHKFYVHGIPNPKAGQEYPQYIYDTPREGEKGWERYQDGFSSHDGKPLMSWRKLMHMAKCPPAVHAKWYNDHLLDLTPDTFAIVAPLLEKHAGIRWQIKDGKLGYAAPCAGYQR